MTAALLDVNILLALSWPNHEHHPVVKAWFDREADRGWATCMLTQLSFVRLSANPAFSPNSVTPEEAVRILRNNLTHPHHQYWKVTPVCQPEWFRIARGHQQVTDAGLIEMAKYHGGRIVTLDRRMTVLDPSGVLVEVLDPHSTAHHISE